MALAGSRRSGEEEEKPSSSLLVELSGTEPIGPTKWSEVSAERKTPFGTVQLRVRKFGQGFDQI